MKIAVTGASGFVGTYLSKQLTISGHQLILLTSKKNRQSERNSVYVENYHDKSHLVDILSGCECVIHLIAKTHSTGKYESVPIDEFRNVNVDITASIANASVSAGVKKFIFLSSIKVNGEETREVHFKYDSDCNPQDAYGKTKLEAEQALIAICHSTPMNFVVLRPPLVYGIGAKGNLATVLKLLKSGLPMPLGAIDNRRSLISIENLCSIIIKCIGHSNANNRVLLVSDGKPRSTPEIFSLIGEIHDCRATLISVPIAIINRILSFNKETLKKLTGDLVIDSRFTEDLLDWKPTQHNPND